MLFRSPIDPKSATPTPAATNSRAASRTARNAGSVKASTAVRVEGELTDMYVKGDSLEVIFKNTGKVRTNILGEIQVQTVSDSVVATVLLDSATVLAGATRRFRVAMPKLPRGNYLLVALVDFGGERLTAVQASLEMR